jgi:hypothetical protein
MYHSDKINNIISDKNSKNSKNDKNDTIEKQIKTDTIYNVELMEIIRLEDAKANNGLSYVYVVDKLDYNPILNTYKLNTECEYYLQDLYTKKSIFSKNATILFLSIEIKNNNYIYSHIVKLCNPNKFRDDDMRIYTLIRFKSILNEYRDNYGKCLIDFEETIKKNNNKTIIDYVNYRKKNIDFNNYIRVNK